MDCHRDKKSIMGTGFDMERNEIVDYRGSESFIYFDLKRKR